MISDDLDSPTAVVKLKKKGGHGGHNGLRSIIQNFGGGDQGQGFPRLKIGIGRPEGRTPVHEYVLQSFRKVEQPDIEKAIYDGQQIVRSILKLGLEKALSGVRA